MKSLIICVNYNTYSNLEDYLQSIDASSEQTKKLVLDVCVVDNTVENYKEITYTPQNFNLRVFPFYTNYGYFGGAIKCIEEIGENSMKEYDYVIISNVDVSLTSSFFNDLGAIKQDNYGWIAPKIIRKYDNSNENPFMPERPSKKKIQLLCFIYKHPTIFKLMNWYSLMKHKKRPASAVEKPRIIYAGMGSIFILTKKFFEHNYPLRFPAFMYGEEIHIAELVRKSGLLTYYDPSVLVWDVCGVSTGKLNIKKKCSMMYEGIHSMLVEHFN